MQTKHTPGPWTLESVEASEGNKRIHVYFRINGADGKAVAGYSRGELSLYRDDEPNARLISTAPDGYAMAVELIRGDGTADSLQRVIDMARALIAKIEGTAAPKKATPRIALVHTENCYTTPDGAWEIRKGSNRRWYVSRRTDRGYILYTGRDTLKEARDALAFEMREEAMKAQADAR